MFASCSTDQSSRGGLPSPAAATQNRFLVKAIAVMDEACVYPVDVRHAEHHPTAFPARPAKSDFDGLAPRVTFAGFDVLNGDRDETGAVRGGSRPSLPLDRQKVTGAFVAFVLVKGRQHAASRLVRVVPGRRRPSPSREGRLPAEKARDSGWRGTGGTGRRSLRRDCRRHDGCRRQQSQHCGHEQKSPHCAGTLTAIDSPSRRSRQSSAQASPTLRPAPAMTAMIGPVSLWRGGEQGERAACGPPQGWRGR
jgi:hypothetical protein